MEVERRYATESLCRENRGLKPTATVGPRYARESAARRVPWMLPNCIVTAQDDEGAGFHLAASMQEMICMTQPSQTSHRRPPTTKCSNAASTRPWTSWPRPGKKKLASAAMTLPDEP